MEGKNVIRIACLTALTAITSMGYASGFRLPEVSTLGIATSNALVANTTETGALAYNPAGMSFQDKNALALGITHLGYDLSVDPTGGTPHDNVGQDTFYIPNVFFMTKDTGPWSFGLAVNSPFGLETKWDAGTFPNFAGGLAVLHPETSRIVMINTNPNLAYKIDPQTSVAFGLDYYNLRELIFNTQAIKIEGNGTAFGWNIALQKKLGDFDLGLSYRSRVSVDLAGTFDGSGIAQPVLGVYSNINFPDMLQAGIHYQATNQLGLELDVEHTGWSSFNQIRVTSSSGGTLTTSTNNWEDGWAYRFGLIYELNSATKLMFGYAKDNAVQPDAYFSARVPDANRQLLSLGMSHAWNDWLFEAAYMHAGFDDRTINSSTAYAGGDPNGTAAYNGVYKATVNLIGLGLTKKF